LENRAGQSEPEQLRLFVSKEPPLLSKWTKDPLLGLKIENEKSRILKEKEESGHKNQTENCYVCLSLDKAIPFWSQLGTSQIALPDSYVATKQGLKGFGCAVDSRIV
jgi:hypothetical protein